MMKQFYTYIIYNSRRIIPILLVSLCLQVLVSSCERRPLEDEGSVTALVSFHIDWSKSGLDVSKMHRASIWFFPHDGSASFEWRLEKDLTNATVSLPVGKYSLVVFNETIDETDWKSLAFEGQAKYETFHVYATRSDFKGLFARADRSDLRNTPEAVASWSMDEFEVTPDMIAYTRGHATKSANDGAISKSLDPLATITPLPLTVSAHVQAYVQHLKSALRCSAALEGATGAISLATGLPIQDPVTHIFIMNNRKYDITNPLNGTIEANFLLFKLVTKDTKYGLQLDFELHDGTIVPPEYFDITKQIDKEKLTIEVVIGVKESETDHPIILPEVSVENDVGVDGWGDVEIPIH